MHFNVFMFVASEQAVFAVRNAARNDLGGEGYLYCKCFGNA